MEEDKLILATDLCTHYNIEMSFIHLLEDHDLIQTVIIKETAYVPASQLIELEKMIHLYYELQVNFEGIDIIRHLLRKLELAHTEIESLKNRIRFYDQ